LITRVGLLNDLEGEGKFVKQLVWKVNTFFGFFCLKVNIDLEYLDPHQIIGLDFRNEVK
jgi:hypothetical protein